MDEDVEGDAQLPTDAPRNQRLANEKRVEVKRDVQKLASNVRNHFKILFTMLYGNYERRVFYEVCTKYLTWILCYNYTRGVQPVGRGPNLGQ